MDLLQTVRKEGSRGGVNFSWSDVKTSQHRENYLGHSLMAPVGRWQQNKDLSWYAKAEDAELTPEQRAEKEREAKKEELRKVKEAEEDAMARALGLPVPDRTNANLQPLGMSKEANKALKDALDDGGEDEEERGVGYGKHGATNGDNEREIIRGSKSRDDKDRRREKQRDYENGEERSSKRADRDRDQETVTETTIEGDDIGVTGTMIPHYPDRGQALQIRGGESDPEAEPEDAMVAMIDAEKYPPMQDREVVSAIVLNGEGEMIGYVRDHVHLEEIEEGIDKVDDRTGNLQYINERLFVPLLILGLMEPS